MQCPICRAENDTPPACRRCKADLSMLWDVHQSRCRALVAARTALSHVRLTDAQIQLDHAESILRDEETERLRALLNLLRGDFVGALGNYRAAHLEVVLKEMNHRDAEAQREPNKRIG